jgi:hypothetical protein
MKWPIKWEPIEDGPEWGEDCLVGWPGGPIAIGYCNSDVWNDKSHVPFDPQPTHFQLLPAAPCLICPNCGADGPEDVSIGVNGEPDTGTCANCATWLKVERKASDIVLTVYQSQAKPAGESGA